MSIGQEDGGTGLGGRGEKWSSAKNAADGPWTDSLLVFVFIPFNSTSCERMLSGGDYKRSSAIVVRVARPPTVWCTVLFTGKI